MRLLIYEHVAGGGFSGEGIPPSTLSEGYGMLRALILDFKAAGHNVTAFLDARLMTFNPPIEADNVIPVSSRKGLGGALRKISKAVDAVYIIAPESNHTLEGLVKDVEASGGALLNAEAGAIEKASNKAAIYGVLERAGLRVPKTSVIDLNEDIKHVKQIIYDMGFPLVFKPADGVGCCGLSVVSKEGQIAVAVDKIRRESTSKYFIVQEFVRGVAASVSLISTGTRALPITVNEQMLTLAPPNSNSSYDGGIVSIHHPLEKEALKAASVAVESLSGLRGYVGVDMVLTSEGPVVMEINPRLTTSYVGLGRVVNFNPAQAIVDAVFDHKLPENVQSRGYAIFSKVKVHAPSPKALLMTYGLEEVMSPPFPVTGGGAAYALLITNSATLRDAKVRLYRAKRRLLEALSQSDRL